MTDVIVLTHESASLNLILWDETSSTLSFLHSSDKGKGHASQLLRKMETFCDLKGLTVLLEVEAFDEGGPNNSQLKKFYERYGFVVIDDEDSILMERKPK
jgi:ribosomal protein S18 acetylase RimI-like enzyme